MKKKKVHRLIRFAVIPIIYLVALQAGKLTIVHQLQNPWLDSTPHKLVLESIPISESHTVITQKLYKIYIPGDLDTKQLEGIIAYSNEMMTFGFAGGNSKGLPGVIEITGEADAYHAYSRFYNATTTDLLNMWSLKSIEQHQMILILKKGLLLDSADNYFAEYDRGDFNGFISGDIAKGKCLVEIFPTNEPLNCLTIGFGSPNRNVRQSNILDLLVRIKIESLTSE